MKRTLWIACTVAGLALLPAFKGIKFEPDYATARVSKIDGFYIFSDSKPVLPYDSLDSMTPGLITDTQYESLRASLIKRARKKYPDANGLILRLNRKGIDRCTVIKFR